MIREIVLSSSPIVISYLLSYNSCVKGSIKANVIVVVAVVNACISCMLVHYLLLPSIPLHWMHTQEDAPWSRKRA